MRKLIWASALLVFTLVLAGSVLSAHKITSLNEYTPTTTHSPVYRDGTLYSYVFHTFGHSVYLRNNSNTDKAVRYEKNGYFFTYDLASGKLQWRAKLNQPSVVETLGSGTPSNSQDTQIFVNGTVVTYAGAFYNTNVIYDLNTSMLKETFVLTGLPSLKDYFYLEYTGNIQFNASLDICANDICYKPSGTQDDFETSGQIDFRDQYNNTIFYLLAPKVWDSNGVTIPAIYSVHGSNAQMSFWLRINKTFLETAAWPIYVDPSVGSAIEGTPMPTATSSNHQLVQTSDDKLYAAFVNTVNTTHGNLFVHKSTDFGENWVQTFNKSVKLAETNQIEMFINSSNHVVITGYTSTTTNNKLYNYWSNDGFQTYSNTNTTFVGTYYVQHMNSVVGANDKIFACAVLNTQTSTQNAIYFLNWTGTNWTNSQIIWENYATGTSARNYFCDIEIDSNNMYSVVTANSSGHIKYFRSSDTVNWNMTNTTLKTSNHIASYQGNGDPPSLVVGTNNNMFLLYTNASIVFPMISNSTDGTSWNNPLLIINYIGLSTSALMDDYDKLHALTSYYYSTFPNPYIYYSSSSDIIHQNWVITRYFIGGGGTDNTYYAPQFENTRFPSFNNASTNARYLYFDSDANIVYYDSIVVNYIAPNITAPALISTSTNRSDENIIFQTTYTHKNRIESIIVADWYKNGIFLLNTNSSTVSNGDTVNLTLNAGNYSKGNNISISIHALDTQGSWSLILNSTNVTIVNIPPIITGLTFTPSIPNISTILTCSITGANDSDNSLFYTYQENATSTNCTDVLCDADWSTTFTYGGTTTYWNITNRTQNVHVYGIENLSISGTISKILFEVTNPDGFRQNYSGSNYCFQETANVSNNCGGLSNGTYSWGSSYHIYINYTKPSGATNNSLWQIKYNNSITNFSINGSCWNTFVDKIVLRVTVLDNNGGGGSGFYCENDTNQSNDWSELYYYSEDSIHNNNDRIAVPIYGWDGNYDTYVTSTYNEGVGIGWLNQSDSPHIFYEEGMYWHFNNTHHFTFTNTSTSGVYNLTRVWINDTAGNTNYSTPNATFTILNQINYYFNYSKTVSATDAIWQVNSGGISNNWTLSLYNCFNSNTQLKYIQPTWYCWNSTGWYNLGVTGDPLYEEAIWWVNMSSTDTLTYNYKFLDSDNTILQNFSTNSSFYCNTTSYCTKNDNITCSAYVSDGTDNSSISNSSLTIYNSKPIASYTTFNVTSNGSRNIYRCLVGGTSDLDGDTLSYYYTFYNGLTTLQAESTTSTYTVDSGVGTHGEILKCIGRVYDSTDYSGSYTNQTHLKIVTPNISTAFSTDVTGTLSTYINSSAGTISSVNISITDPSGTEYNHLEMTYNAVTGLWDYSFAPSVSGAWTIKNVYALQSTGEGYAYIGTASDIFSVTARVVAVSGGGGGGGIVEIPIAVPVNFTEGCGDGICVEGETPINCWQDCRINYDTLFTCLYDDSIACNWEQTWFPVFLIISLIAIGLTSIYLYEIRGKEKQNT